VTAHDAWPLRGLTTYGGEGQQLTDRWFGTASQGTGKLWAGGLNWTGSVRRILFRGAPVSSDDPDITLNVGLAVAYTLTNTQPLNGTTNPSGQALDSDTFNHRFRWKAGVDALYNILPWMGLELRVDRVAPNSKDAEETFYVVSPRVVFKTSWISHETIQLIYGKWFYGADTHPEASSLVSGDIALDDQLIALNANMWW
jgi:hypothetical protein